MSACNENRIRKLNDLGGYSRLPYGKIVAQLKANTRHVTGGIANQAIAAVENALLDVVGKVIVI